MSKFRIKMKLTGLELEIEGSRDEMPQITRNLSQQFAGLLQPAAGIADGKIVGEPVRTVPPPAAIPVAEHGAGAKRRGTRRRRTGGTATSAPSNGQGSALADLVVELTHDPARFGVPKQDWSTVNKTIWLLYVVAEQTGRRELTAHQIEATFNRHFREAKQILVQNIARDLGRLRNKPKDAPVAEDNTMDPSPWYLTEAGRTTAQKLVGKALGSAGANGSREPEGQGTEE